MNLSIPVTAALTLAVSTLAYADNDCLSPMSEWQPREAVTRYVTELGITAERLRVDDGCYEVRGLDADGNRVELEIEPATLAIQKLEVSFQPQADPARYLPRARAAAQ